MARDHGELSTNVEDSKYIYSRQLKKCPFERRMYDASPFLVDSACITGLEYFLFRFRPVKMCPHRESKETYSFSSIELVDR